jgi:cytochrome c peroxidase
VRIEYIVDAISSFIRTLNTTDSPFDRYLIGDKGALNRDQQQGLKLFRDYGCISCHNGAGLGGNLIQKNHLIDEYFDEHPEANEADLGLFVRTRDEYDRYAFRVPPLRNITLTAPYFHDGSSETLDHAIEEMAEHQLGIDLSPQEKGLIARFLESLTGTMPDSGTGVK